MNLLQLCHQANKKYVFDKCKHMTSLHKFQKLIRLNIYKIQSHSEDIKITHYGSVSTPGHQMLWRYFHMMLPLGPIKHQRYTV